MWKTMSPAVRSCRFIQKGVTSPLGRIPMHSDGLGCVYNDLKHIVGLF